MLFMCLLLIAGFGLSARAQSPDNPPNNPPEFPPDPGELYIPPTVIIMGQEVEITDPSDSTVTIAVVDVLGDSSILFNTEENVLTLNSTILKGGDEKWITAISYRGTDPLVIVLCDSSTIIADTVITSTSDVYITGEGTLIAEGIVPIYGSRNASITFDSVNMIVRSLKGHESVRRRVQGVKHVDENGGPALSGFGSADFNKTNVSPSEAEYTEVTITTTNDDGEEETTEEYALVVVDEDGNVEILTEFELTAETDEEVGILHTYTRQPLDLRKPMFNILGLQVDATYRGLVIQNGQKYLLR